MHGGPTPDPAYVGARTVLLDVLEYLNVHRDSVILVGAQAIYLHVGDDDLAIAPHTTDGDLVIDPNRLLDEPRLSTLLAQAGFTLAIRPGTWRRHDVPIDLLVPTALAGPGRRGARLGPHGNDVARRAAGLEATLVDHAHMRIRSLERTDVREFDVRVAGVASLLVAKVHKLAERQHDVRRLEAKDALDVLRLLRHSPTADLARTLARLERDPLAGVSTTEARTLLAAMFGSRDGVGASMAAHATVGLENADTVRQSCEVLTKRLMNAWGAQRD